MSDDYRFVALGKQDFVLPYGATGFEFEEFSNQEDVMNYIARQDFKKTVFLVDEDIISNIKKVKEQELEGANILIIKGWGKSKLAEDKIRAASIKAIGTDMTKEKR